jgi:phosphoribosylformimino-5-aminoimidazole carboxamide ribotide isomerase
MLNITIIPAIDLIGGKCVRLTRGDYSSEKVYSEDPLDVAKAFEAAGAKRLHLVDLDGAKASQPQNLKTLEAIASQTGLEVEFGGGIKSDKSLKAALDEGAGYIVCGSVAVTNPDMAKSWMESYGSRIILGIDVRNGLVATRGWLESSRLSAEDLLKSYGGLVSETEITEISMTAPCKALMQNSILAFKDGSRKSGSSRVGESPANLTWRPWKELESAP